MHLAGWSRCRAVERRQRIQVLLYAGLLQPRWFWQRGLWRKDLPSFLGLAASERVWENRAVDERLPEIKAAGESVGRALLALCAKRW